MTRAIRLERPWQSLASCLLWRQRLNKGPNGHNYTEVYEYFFLPLKYAPIRILEIGIEEGGSLRLWEKYFPNATIFGI